MSEHTLTKCAGNICDRIRSEAAIADRPGQMERLETIAAEVERLLCALAKVEALANRAEARVDVGHHLVTTATLRAALAPVEPATEEAR